MKTEVFTQTGAVLTEGTLAIRDEDSAEIKWANGLTWIVYAAGNRRLLVQEYNGPVSTDDGIMLFR